MFSQRQSHASVTSVLFLLAFLLTAIPARAQQFVLTVPTESQRASVMQTVGLTEVSLTYDRPGVNGRKIWGGLVPYDSVWRAGANINTVIAFTSPVTVGGTQLPAGRYGLFMIPTATTWTVILSKEANAWGHFSYKQSEDALRFTVTPVPGPMVEKLEYTLDDPKQDGVTVTLRWEQLTIPFPIAVKSTEVVMDSLRQQLRGLPRFFPDAWRMASAWAFQHDQLAMASSWADSAIALGPTFGNLMLKSRVLAKQGNQAAADSVSARALTMANEADMNAYGYALIQAGKLDSAIVVFTNNTKKYPNSWNVWDSLGEAYGLKGDKKQAVADYKKALAMAPPAQTQRINGAIAALQK